MGPKSNGESQKSPYFCAIKQNSKETLAAYFPRFMKSIQLVRLRQTVFGWTTQRFPFGVKTAHKLKIREQHVITVAGKAFYDIGHAPADHSNRRSTPKGYAGWELQRVMKVEVIRRSVGN